MPLPTYNSAVVRASLLLHRLLIVLAFAGLFVAGTLSIGHILGATVPCGAPSNGISGCEAVSRHPSGQWFGVPVAFFGLFAYVGFAVLSVLRSTSGLAAGRKFTAIGFGLSAAGTTLSVYLLYTAFFVIGATCYWCLASAAIMTLTLLAHGALLQSDPDQGSLIGKDATALGICAVLALGGVGMMTSRLRSVNAPTQLPVNLRDELTLEKLAIPPKFFKGNPKARLTLVEYADFFCPACRATYPKLMDLERLYADKIHLAFVNYPLFQKEGHEFSLMAAGASVYAAEYNKYWEFVDVMFMSDVGAVNSEAGIKAALTEVGLKPDDFLNRWKAADDKLMDPIADLQASAQRYGVDRTPTVLILRDGKDPVFAYERLEEVLKRPEYAELLK